MKVGSGVVGNPITFTGADHKQYVAVYAGIGGDWFLLSGGVRSDDPADVRPPADFMPDIPRHTSPGGIAWIFALWYWLPWVPLGASEAGRHPRAATRRASSRG